MVQSLVLVAAQQAILEGTVQMVEAKRALLRVVRLGEVKTSSFEQLLVSGVKQRITPRKSANLQ